MAFGFMLDTTEGATADLYGTSGDACRASFRSVGVTAPGATVRAFREVVAMSLLLRISGAAFVPSDADFLAFVFVAE
jgi:hypothetical protein